MLLSVLLLYLSMVAEAVYVAKVEIVQVFVDHRGKNGNHMTSISTSYSSTAPKTTSATASGTSSTTASQSSSQSSGQSSISYDGPYSFNETFAQEMLSEHNKKRALHRAQQLEWNSTVFDYAANYAQKYDCSGKLKHSGGPYGENLAVGYSPIAAVDAWYDEGKSYKYGTESTYDHFTALVWNSTSQLGCAYKNCNSEWGTYIVCSYYTAGNVVGESSKNVFPPK
ncbi:Piso0_003241 [Millerozyma farinosa CBS 7064]|uniref:Piso0_003241 protein n=1 Tax=Pichia sorbitophila (strain ATCC MYA-4447 / BCRC 22081 / CBS 7064 / NBRC 10061 / NRRL Y-12695) TaxID=559304 RepID=G8YHK4_PICSO|nr:Piso0_003241 [Millerozyma farinosa CBS 7064]CCE80906.1 Piso0_003241 [Millerozyma farinosa CBS 7064]